MTPLNMDDGPVANVTSIKHTPETRAEVLALHADEFFESGGRKTSGGSFITGLFTFAGHCDNTNLDKLRRAFPDEITAYLVRRSGGGKPAA